MMLLYIECVLFIFFFYTNTPKKTNTIHQHTHTHTPTELVLDRTDKDWNDALDTKYYLYPVHVSLSFMFTPTLASALYLLLLRFLHRDYSQVFQLANAIGTDTTFSAEESNIFQAIGEANGYVT